MTNAAAPGRTVPAKILVIDDKPVNIDVIRALLSDQPYEFHGALSGHKALEMVPLVRPDLVLLDIAMPDMDGIAVCRALREDPANENLPVIFVTAMGSRLEEAFSAGGSDFINKPVQREELICRIRTHLQIRTQFRKLQQLSGHLTREREIAQYVMESVIRGNVYPPGLSVLHQPQNEFSGDLVMSAQHPERGLYLLVADFTGHGLAAAIGTVPVSLTFRTMTEKGLPADQLAFELNRVLLHTVPDEMFCAAVVANLEPSGTRIHLWQGGLPDGYLVTPASGIRRLPSSHMPLAAEDEEDFDGSLTSIDLQAGDRLYFLTDGIIETFDANGEMFGEQRLEALLGGAGDDTVESVRGAATRWRGALAQDDDITFVELRPGT